MKGEIIDITFGIDAIDGKIVKYLLYSKIGDEIYVYYPNLFMRLIYGSDPEIGDRVQFYTLGRKHGCRKIIFMKRITSS